MKPAVALLLLSSAFSNIFAQDVSLIPYFDGNITWVKLKSNKQFNRDLDLQPKPGFNAGVITRLSLREKTNFDFSVAFKQRRNKGEPLIFASPWATPIALVENTVVNNYVGLGLLYHYKFKFNLYLGSGMELNFLAVSKTLLNEYLYNSPGGSTNPMTINGEPLDDKFKNHYFRPFNMGLPVIISYEIKRIWLSLRYEASLLSRIKNAEMKEREHTLSLGFGYMILKDGKFRAAN